MMTLIESHAEIIDAAANSATAVSQLSLKQEFDLAQAYDIQRKSIEKRISRGEQLVGLKLGFTSRAKMEQMGVHDLIWGRLTDAMQFCDGDNLYIDQFIHPRAEPEIAFRIAKDIDKNITLEEISDYVDGVAAAIEIIDSRYENFKFSLEDVVADNCSSSGFVIGDWKSIDTDLSDLAITLSVDGEIVQEGKSNAILGNPWESVVEAARLGIANNQNLKKGMILLAGAATPAVYIEVGKVVSANIAQLGELKLSIC